MSPRLVSLATFVAAVCLAAPATAQPTMDELWPNQDGLSWTYEQRFEDFVKPLLVENRTRIFLDGTVTAAGGILAQYLRQELVSGPAIELAEPALADPFLRQLWAARPDLRSKILERGMDADCPDARAPGSYGVLFNGELAYLKSAKEVAAWRCNLASTRSWLWLVSDITLGNTFTLQLVPDLASNVFLHGEIAAVEPVTVPAGMFKHCVRVDYVVDYGSSVCTDDSGKPLGAFRSETRGYIHYAPGVGPVQSFEEFIEHAVLIGTCTGLPEGEPATRVTMRMDTTPTPVRRASWGQIKAVYR